MPLASFLRAIVQGTPLGPPLRNWAVRRRQTNEYAAWVRQGRPVPPPHLAKQRLLTTLADRHGLEVLVETGTYLGDMIEAMKSRFGRVISIELSRDLYERAARRFHHDAHVELVHGDSGAALGPIVARLSVPALFWLDGHHSAGETAKGDDETPILAELGHILDAPERRHVIVVDDARLFGTDPAYPTLEALEAFVHARRPGVGFEVENDAIVIAPA